MSPAQEKITNWLAAGAVLSPGWLPTLEQASAWAAFILSLMGIVWFAVQLVHRIKHWNDRPKP